ncbi:AbrB/MazE/SpoVT family DNA-binding domain-containing protein [Pediococcus acidilactici]|uniref:AbrB/MazE/SpoVT family DNA-binding domain-containing protein n=1 Tax=Pediococcus acidilactici TaxID=1254 RepID=UPI00132F9165|nr:type II toxin-antitoxin system PrlF family antitoxin [Pediococcus acidilactici]KAF0501014.1 AbrB/MazE/SpoVT family DNA-binding domain-containing protein [Pediococcus acidilactici]
MMAKNLTKVRSKITSKNQVTIPKTVRDLLNVKSADTIEWQIEPNGTVTIVQSKPDLWQVVDQQAQKYGKVNTPEVDWGTDLESEDFD